MNIRIILVTILSFITNLSNAQKDLPTDYLSSEFHKNRREALRKSMPENSVAVFFANAVRNRANDVDYVYHQDPNFYYLTGYNEPHAVLLIFSEEKEVNDVITNELIYVQKRDASAEMWTGRRLGVEGVGANLGFSNVFNGEDFKDLNIDFSSFDKVLFTDFKNDVRDSKTNEADLYNLIEQFKIKVSYEAQSFEIPTEEQIVEIETNIDVEGLKTLMASLREVKTEDELVLLKKACEISAVGQMEVMKAMHPNMSEAEVQGVHEYIYKKYGAEYEGYPSIVGGGNNGCVLHYIENTKTKLDNDLVLMDLGAEYHGYTADVTRTIPANGKFNKQQRLIYDLVYDAQEAGIKETVVGSDFKRIDSVGREIINKGLYKLGIIDSVGQKHTYFPHGTSHHIGLDVHDLSNRGELKENMVITVEPGIYIPEGSPCDEKWWGIAVRIEDCILVTKNGPFNYSGMAPRDADEIEDLMKEESILNAFTLPKLD
ncbi:aminopeptidase P N-terminal domain-containing protein [Urechidicola croceus]|uniref:Xaa-Pro aminopeptidase n=1 Tax=Urechidicola croceus TaxID=1850246 RepID=A0A1D8P5N0_9FLAO|nr:aminopeptidase P N-terminal domain-containing protein [Urechidicola croceus]AOW19854.1 Xaa-Pro aminopeptidase [Urechidicola croceus]